MGNDPKQRDGLNQEKGYEKLQSVMTLAEASKRSHAKPRTLQFWTTNGVINCVPETMHGGPGVRRKYIAQEVCIAWIMDCLSESSISVGSLRDIASDIRKSFSYGLFRNDKIDVINLALMNTFPVAIEISSNEDMSWDVVWTYGAEPDCYAVEKQLSIVGKRRWGAVFVFNATDMFRDVLS